jgi:hypothetical protein
VRAALAAAMHIDAAEQAQAFRAWLLQLEGGPALWQVEEEFALPLTQRLQHRLASLIVGSSIMIPQSITLVDTVRWHVAIESQTECRGVQVAHVHFIEDTTDN